MTEWRLPDAIDAIVAELEPLAEAATPPFDVWDGPIVSGSARNAVYIGYDANPNGDEEYAASTQQEWAGIGQRKRDEWNTITCAVVVLLGNQDESWKPARDTLKAIFEVVGQTIRTSSSLGPSLGLSPPSVADVVPGDYFQEPNPNGHQARLLFTIRYKTRV